MAKRTSERVQFLADVLTTAIEGGVGYWSYAEDYRWDLEKYTADEIGVTLSDCNDEDDPDFPPTRVTLDIIAKGIGVIKRMEHAPNYFGDGGSYWKQFLLADRTNGEDGDYDAIVADWIVQAGLFGEIVYG